MIGERKRAPAGEIAALAALLVLTAAISLVWSHVKLLSQDEFFVLQTDSVRSVGELVHIQRTYPISLDPLVYHLLAHACTKIFGPSALALRIPSICGFLLMQLCVFFIVRRIAGGRAGLIAAAFPAFTATLFYAPEARPYGLLLGFYALTLLAWQSATREESHNPQRSRRGVLILLAVAIGLTLNTHYFGILLLVPLCAAELARTILRRRIDVPVIASIAAGIACFSFTIPFQHAATEFRQHYYNAGEVSLHAMTQAYRSLFVDYVEESIRTQQIADVLLVIFAISLIALCARRIRRREVTLPVAELVFLATLAALPIFGFFLALFVTHSIEVRYVLGAIIAIAAFFAIAVAPLARKRVLGDAAVLLCMLAVLLGGMLRITAQNAKSRQYLADLILPPAVRARLLALPDAHLYIQDMGHFEVDSFYEPDPEVRSRMALLYSRDQELKWDLHDTASLTAMHMQHFTGFTIMSWEQLQQQPGDHLLVLYHSGWDWTDGALANSNADVTQLGSALEGDAVAVRFR
ncbi:MAG TPA: glycosyltransferase family 39 protein [Acidobacteriaceae bacterium]|nr:glycosyltransferase family 39 protein [Acidobacteriaceae bacterium]